MISLLGSLIIYAAAGASTTCLVNQPDIFTGLNRTWGAVHCRPGWSWPWARGSPVAGRNYLAGQEHCWK